jgi:hypothetical protein
LNPGRIPSPTHTSSRAGCFPSPIRIGQPRLILSGSAIFCSLLTQHVNSCNSSYFNRHLLLFPFTLSSSSSIQHTAVSQLIHCLMPNSTVAAALLYWLFPDCQYHPIAHAAPLAKKSCHPYHRASSRCATHHHPSARTGHSLSDAPLHLGLTSRAWRARRAVASRPELIPFSPVMNHLSPSIKGQPVTCCSTSPSLEAEQPLSTKAIQLFSNSKPPLLLISELIPPFPN